MASEAFIKLVELAHRSRNNALELPSKSEAETYWSGVGFSLGGMNYVAPMGEVTEILRIPRFTKVPGVRSWVMGVANVRGRLLLIIDLMSFFQKRSELQARQRRLLVIERDEIFSGLMVDEVLGVQHFPVVEYEPLETPLDDSMAPFVSGEFPTEGSGRWLVFSLKKLSEDPTFLRAAS